MNLDFSFYNWDLISNFVLKGLYFSLMLTVVATIGGVLFGTVLALMRLSGRKWLVVPATIRPGTRARRSIRANTRFTANAEMAYSAVTAM